MRTAGKGEYDVVMQDGRIEQIGTPLELYDRPANLFVAQFIGSPAMNVVSGVVRRQGGHGFVQTEGGVRWPLNGHGGADGQRVFYGVRPEQLALAEADASVQAEVIVVEPTGAETELLMNVGGDRVIVVIHGRTNVKPGDRVGLAIEIDGIGAFPLSTLFPRYRLGWFVPASLVLASAWLYSQTKVNWRSRIKW